METVLYKTLSEEVLGCAFRVHTVPGPGLFESVYEEALCVELSNAGIRFERQRRYPVRYRDVFIGEYIADLVVDGTIVLEPKAVKALTEPMEAHLLNCLKLSGLAGCLRKTSFSQAACYEGLILH